VKNNSPAGELALDEFPHRHKRAGVIPISLPSGCGFSFAALVHIPLFFSGAQRQMKKTESSALFATLR
jgi:hypothetical protein